MKKNKRRKANPGDQVAWENLTKEELAGELKTDLKSGLGNAEAKKRYEADGPNELPKAKTRPWIITFLLALIEPLQIVLIIAAIISVVAPVIAGQKPEFIDFGVILMIVFLDAILETVQAVQARKSVDALKVLSKPIAVVIRNGKQFEIEASELVVGDLVVIEAGKYIPAELRLVQTSDFEIDESVLTGESNPVRKVAAKIAQTKILADKDNMAFMSTFAVTGRAIGVVVATGANTEIGKIAQTINENADVKTPLEKKLTSFSYWISIVAVLIGAIVFVLLYFSSKTPDGWTQYLLIAITLAIGVIPESLSAIVSITLSLSTKRMAKENVIVKKLASVETLGSVNVICTDKTGTLTQNKMTVKKVLYNNDLYDDDQFVKLMDQNAKDKELFVNLLVLPNDAITDGEQRIGDPTELALVDLAEKMGVDEIAYRRKYKRIDEIPFDSKRKMMTTLNVAKNGKKISFTKGGIDEVLHQSKYILLNNEIVVLTKEIEAIILKNAGKMSSDALRVLGFAYHETTSNQPVEEDLIFVGAVGMIDPVRESAVQAVREAHQAHIRVVMITGDHVKTALAIAKELDIAFTEYEVMSSDTLESMSDDELERIIDNIRVFARVNPEHKVRIVRALQNKGNITSMTGDGVNDAPSLSIADIGVAMGISGTDVAKEAADVILTDDNFGTIMVGVNEGRNVYQKIKRTIVFLLGVNIANVLSILIISLISHQPALTATDILWINLIVESILAISMGMGPVDDNLMTIPPVKGNNNLLKGLGWPITKVVFMLTLTEIGSFYIGMLIGASQVKVDDTNIVYGRTALFITATLAPTFLAHIIKITNWKASRKIDWKMNKPLIAMSAVAISLNILVIFVPGLNHEIFRLMTVKQWGEKNNIWILFSSVGFSALAPFLVLVVDSIIFFSYHYTKNPWNRNRDLVNKYVVADQNRAKKRNHKRNSNA